MAQRNRGQYTIISFITIVFVNWPKTPEIELIKINNEAVVTIFFGLSAFNKKSIGLKKIPPPIPTIPEINPKVEPIIKDVKKFIFLF